MLGRACISGRVIICNNNSNDRETKRLNKKQLKDVENGKNLEEIKENSSEQKVQTSCSLFTYQATKEDHQKMVFFCWQSV